MPIIRAPLLVSRFSSCLPLRKTIQKCVERGRICWHRRDNNYLVASTLSCAVAQRLPADHIDPKPSFQHDAFLYSIASFIASAVASFAYYYNFQNSTTSCFGDDDHHDTNKQMFRIEVDLMDKIAKRPYLHPYNSFGAWQYQGDDEYDGHEMERAFDGGGETHHSVIRPPGVPHTLRILALDMPEMKRAFTGGACFLSRNHVFPSGIAPPKHCFATAAVRPSDGDVDIAATSKSLNSRINPQDSKQQYGNNILATSAINLQDDGTVTTAPPQTKLVRVNYRIEQKSVAKSMLHCYSPQTDQISVQVLMGSIADLNPNHVHPSKRRRSHSTHHQHVEDNVNQRENQGIETVTSVGQLDNVAQVYSKIKDDLEAPWNQHAWMDELELRISGRVRFGAPMERASPLSRLLGRRNVYQQTIASSRTAIDWFLFPSLQTDPAGMDGKDRVENNHDNGDSDQDVEEEMVSNWASQRPHVVIANGMALRKVPGSMHLLQRLCRQEQVPLFIYQDRHSWRGCHVYDDLNELLWNMRQTVQQHVIRTALHYHEQGFLFASGRLLGQVEGELRCQMKDRIQAFMSDLRWYLRADPSNPQSSKLEANELEGLLRERKAIQKKLELFPVFSTQRRYNPSFVEVCKACVAVHDAETARKRKA